jgi:divalent metal cation (Fe/Co/Zn/Cd) transporter
VLTGPGAQAFHFGTRFLVEIDVVLPPTMSLHEAHDIGETLQQKIERLDEVERAFVHLDYETTHNPKSEHKQWGDLAAT